MSDNGNGKSIGIDSNKKIVTVDTLDKTVKEVYDKLSGEMENLVTKEELGTKADKSELFSGSYNDLNNKPEIPNIDGLASENYVINTVTSINEKIDELTEDFESMLVKTEQILTDDEKGQVRKNLGFIGKTATEGEQVTVNGKTYTVEPDAEIFGDYATNKAIGSWSIAEGSENVAVGRASHVEGAMNKAIGTGCHVEGVQCTATGYWSHAEGERTIVSSYASHAEGSYTNLPDGTKRYGTASGYASHVEGGGCHASGSCSHAEGLASTVSGNHSHVEGRWTIASSSSQHVEGTANIEDTEGKYIHIAGNGSWNNGETVATRSNAYTLDWNGNGWFAGNVSIGADNKQLATEEFVNNINNNIVESINEINTELETKASTEFVNTMLNGLRLIQMTQSEYDALEVKDSSTLYIII